MSTLAEVLREQRRQLDSRENDAVWQMTSAYGMLERDIEARLYDVNALIEQARMDGGPVLESWIHRQARYQLLLADIEAIERNYVHQADRIMRDAKIAEIRAGQIDANERAGIMGPTTGNATVNYQAVESMIAQVSEFSPVTRILQGISEEHSDAISSRLLTGIANGDSAESIVRDIMKSIGDATPPWRIRNLVRTENMRAYRSSLLDQYENVPEVAGLVWVTHRGPRTCLACLALDGMVFKSREEVPQGHPSCRCSIAPEPEDMYPSVRKYLNQRGTGEDWLRKQSPEAIRKHFTSQAAYDAFMRGDVGLRDFLGKVDHPVWGTSVTQLPTSRVMEAWRLDPYEMPRREEAPHGYPAEDPQQSLSRDWSHRRHTDVETRFADRPEYTRSDLDAWRESGEKKMRKDMALRRWEAYKYGDYESINASMRSGVVTQDDEYRLASFAKSRLKNDAELFRGFSANPEASYMQSIPDDGIGGIIQDRAYISTSSDPYVAQRFADDTSDGKPQAYMLNIRAPKGTPGVGVELNGFNAESEIVLPPGTKFGIYDRYIDDRGRVSFDVVPFPDGTDDASIARMAQDPVDLIKFSEQQWKKWKP